MTTLHGNNLYSTIFSFGIFYIILVHNGNTKNIEQGVGLLYHWMNPRL